MKSIQSHIDSIPSKADPYVNRPGMFDLFKGYAMLTIIITHTLGVYGDDWLLNGSHAFLKTRVLGLYDLLTFGNVLIPIFFVISGWGIKPTNFRTCVKNQFKYLIKPIIYVFVLSLPCSFIVYMIYSRDLSQSLDIVKGIVLSFLTGQIVIDYSGPLNLPGIFTFWFLLALFWGTILLNIILKKVPAKYRFLLVMCISMVTASFGGDLPNPFAIVSALMSVFFLYFGYYIKKNKLINKKIHPVVFIILTIMWVVHSTYSTVNLSDTDIRFGFIDVALCSIFSFMFIRLTLYIDSRIHNKITDGLHYIGRYSLWILSIHTFEYLCIPWYEFCGRITHHVFIDCAIFCLIRIVLNLLLLQVVIIFNKSKKKVWSKA